MTSVVGVRFARTLRYQNSVSGAGWAAATPRTLHYRDLVPGARWGGYQAYRCFLSPVLGVPTLNPKPY